MLGQFQHFVPGVFNGTGLVGAHVARLCRHNTFVLLEQRIDDDGVGLRSAHQQ